MLPDYLTLGYPRGVDAQHEKLFGICERLKRLTVDRVDDTARGDLDTVSGLHRAIKAAAVPHAGVDAETRLCCADLIRYTCEHFVFEGVQMAQVDGRIADCAPHLYGSYSDHHRRHLAEHAALTQHTLIYRAQFEDNLVTALALYVFVRHWLISHIGRVDKELAGWCRVADGLPPHLPSA